MLQVDPRPVRAAPHPSEMRKPSLILIKTTTVPNTRVCCCRKDTSRAPHTARKCTLRSRRRAATQFTDAPSIAPLATSPSRTWPAGAAPSRSTSPSRLWPSTCRRTAASAPIYWKRFVAGSRASTWWRSWSSGRRPPRSPSPWPRPLVACPSSGPEDLRRTSFPPSEPL